MTEMRDDELIVVREFDAPVALVFRLWESREHLVRWWGPERFTTIELDWELVPGRPWRIVMVSKQHGISKSSGVIREVERDKRIVFTFQWDANSGPDRETIATVDLEERDGRTIQTFHQTPFANIASRDSHIGGWNSLFNKQQIYAENFAVAQQDGFNP